MGAGGFARRQLAETPAVGDDTDQQMSSREPLGRLTHALFPVIDVNGLARLFTQGQ